MDPRSRVREAVRPGAGEPLPPNSLQIRHALEMSKPEDADEDMLSISPLLLLGHDSATEVQTGEAQRLLRNAFLRCKLNLEELRPFRVRACWRWAREISVLKCLVNDDETLGEALADSASNPWLDPEAGNAPASLSGYARTRSSMVDLVNGKGGISIMPPAVPLEFLNPDGTAVDEYDPEQDMALRKWSLAFDRVARYLGVMRGTVDNPDEGRFGLWGLQDLATIRLCFPSPVQIMTWEMMLVREAWRHIVNDGQLTTQKTLQIRYGLHDIEVRRLIRLAQEFGLHGYQGDVEINRAMLAARLEDFINRVREAPSDQRAELGAMKLLAQIQGVTRVEADDFMKEVASMMGAPAAHKTIDAKASARSLPP